MTRMNALAHLPFAFYQMPYVIYKQVAQQLESANELCTLRSFRGKKLFTKSQ